MSQVDDTALTVGQRITKLCGDAPRVRIAELLGLDRKTISRWETDQALPDGKSLIAMWRELGASPDWVLTGQGKAPELDGDEVRLLAGFRLAPPSVQQAVMRALDTGAMPRETTHASQTFNAPTGHVFQGDGVIHGGAVHLHDNRGRFERSTAPASTKQGTRKP